MNIYECTFKALCPVNKAEITYHLRISTKTVIMVEELLAFTATLSEGFHEEFADILLKRFGGQQTMYAEHHGVGITTDRGRS